MSKVSVIVPVYNVEEYLPVCLESISKQTYQDFELILVDDGSKDSSGTICDAYAVAHQNTKVIHQANAGVSGARNQGIAAAQGEYVVFIDADDYVTYDYLEYLLYLNEKFETDVSVAGRVIFWDGENPIVPQKPDFEQKMATTDAMKSICYAKMDVFPWGKMYKRHLLKDNIYPVGEVFEDIAMTNKIISGANAVAVGRRCVYFWRQRAGSITHQSVTEKHYFGITAAQMQLDYMKENYPEVVPAAKARCVMKAVDFSYRLIMGQPNPELFKRARKAIKPIVWDVFADANVCLSVKVRAVALHCGYVPYVLISKLYTLAKGSKNRFRGD